MAAKFNEGGEMRIALKPSFSVCPSLDQFFNVGNALKNKIGLDRGFLEHLLIGDAGQDKTCCDS